MRLYVPATLDELTAVVPGPTARWDLVPRVAHAVTPQLVAALPDADDEELEYAAFLAAADDSLALVAAGATVPLRVVVSLEVPDDAVATGATDHEPDGAPSRTAVVRDVPGARVEAVHVDEPEAAHDVRAVLAAADSPHDGGSDDGEGADGEDERLADAVERVAARDLLWYAPAEIPTIPCP
ncbi:DUF6912 family protein [Isoptericola jiangsuensis]|uniref:DUF6912 family protein n=1 Tax=Isoptericola jiangsuensis TaxID=548579 RepID=UPI003AAFCDDF